MTWFHLGQLVAIVSLLSLAALGWLLYRLAYRRGHRHGQQLARLSRPLPLWDHTTMMGLLAGALLGRFNAEAELRAARRAAAQLPDYLADLSK